MELLVNEMCIGLAAKLSVCLKRCLGFDLEK
jgi:hypothetical protein